jgi:hyperosmotically inducible protein
MKVQRFAISLAMSLAFLAAVPAMNAPRAFASQAGQDARGQNDRQIQSHLAQEFNKSRFRNIKVSVSEGIVSLTGSVDLFADKDDAEKMAHHVKNSIAVRNNVRVSGAQISDSGLQAELVKKLEYDRVGYGTTTFNAISVQVREGTVLLTGHAYSPTDKSSALSVASYTPGVQDVVDEIEVDPPSPMDDRIRLNVARLIYGYPSLMKYSIDPGRPIRISVQNGKVTLYGVVDTAADRDTAFIRANSAQGVFKVTNELKVENQILERD